MKQKWPLLFWFIYKIFQRFNPLSPYDASKQIFTSLYTDLISLQLGVL